MPKADNNWDIQRENADAKSDYIKLKEENKQIFSNWKTKFLRNNMNVIDINQGENMGSWEEKKS